MWTQVEVSLLYFRFGMSTNFDLADDYDMFGWSKGTKFTSTDNTLVDNQGCRICVSVSAVQHCCQALFLFCQALFMSDPKWPKNDQKLPKNDQKMTQNGQKMTKNGKNWPKITINGPKWPNMAQKWPKMAQNGPKMTFLKCRDLRVLPGTNFLLPGT